PAMTGRLMVTLAPPEAHGQWRFPWELGWHNSGEVVSNLSQGNYDVLFRNIPGWLPYLPAWQGASAVAVLADGSMTSVTNQYFPTLSPSDSGAASLTVNIGPNVPSGAGWHFLGETAWRSSGSTASNLVPDTYFIEFEPVNFYIKP